MTQREEFESAFKGYNLVRSKSDSSKYGDKVSQRMWEAYQEGFKAAKAQAVPQWIPVSERLPDAGVFCIILDVNGVVVNNQFEYYKQRHIKGYFDSVVDGCVFELTEVTHWMPLPAAPEKQQ